MASVDESRSESFCELQRLLIFSCLSKPVEAIERIHNVVERRRRFFFPLPAPLAGSPLRVFFLQMRGIDKHEAGQLTTGRSRDQFTSESSLHEQWNPAAVIQVGMGQQNIVDGCRIEPEGCDVLFHQVAASLEKTAIDQNASVQAFDRVTRPGHCAIGAMKG